MVLMDLDRYESLMELDKDDAEWKLDELPEEFFSEPALESVVSREPEVDFAPPYESEMVERSPKTPPVLNEEPPGEEQFYLEPID